MDRTAASAPLAHSIAYHPDGSIAGLTYRNGQVLSVAQNARGLVTEIDVRKGSDIAMRLAYAHDANRRITARTDHVTPAESLSYVYDGLGRLSGGSGPWGALSYSYDALGNLRRKQLGAAVVDVEYDAANRVSRARDTRVNGGAWRNFAHDARGNVTSSGLLGFVYDQSNQPVSVSGSAAGSFVYDGHKRRVKQTLAGRTVYSFYSLSGELLLRDDAGDYAKGVEYYRAGGRTIARIKGGGNSYREEHPHQDHLGSPVVGTNPAGAVAWRDAPIL